MTKKEIVNKYKLYQNKFLRLIYLSYFCDEKILYMTVTGKKIKYEKKILKLSAFSKALSHPARIKILQYMEKNSCCYVKDIVKFLPYAQSTISQHIKELKDSGLINSFQESQKTKYCINWSKWQYAKALFNNIFR
jgi:predicted transcriptional regulator